MPADASPGVLEALQDWVQMHSGIAFTRDQVELFSERIAGLCRELALGPETLLARLERGDRALSRRVAEVVSTNYTYFFREPDVFDYVAQQVLPQLPTGALRIWSAATASGDEAYSLAMLCLEQLGQEALLRVRILATDLSERQLAAAERGIYPREQLATLSPERLARWFSPCEGGASVSDSARQLCTFRRFNLTQRSWPFEKRFHLIFLRNVLYYFEERTRQRILEDCFDVAEPGAFLVTSLTEPMLGLRTRWTVVRPAVYRRR